jgi:hypothetical protein
MRRLPTNLTTLTALLAALLFPGCKEDAPFQPPGGPGPSGVVPDFALADVNPNSATTGQAVSPRSYLHQTSAWYFGHAT